MILGHVDVFENERTIEMLVLQRKPGEAILIGDDIRIIINEIRGDRVKIGVEAPRDVVVIREELQKERDNDRP